MEKVAGGIIRGLKFPNWKKNKFKNGVSRWYSRPIFSNFFSEKGRLEGTSEIFEKK